MVMCTYLSSIQPLGWFSRNQSPVRRPVWLWHTASWQVLRGMLPFLSSARCLHVQRSERPLAAEGGTLRGRDIFWKISPRIRIPRNCRDLLHAAISDMGQTALFPLWRKAC